MTATNATDQTARGPRREREAGFTLIELLLVVAIIGIISAIALPGIARSRMSGNEASAIGSLRSIHSAQHAFWWSCGRGFYSPSLQNLGVSDFISPDLSGPAPVLKSGYQINMGTAMFVVGTSCNGGQISVSYQGTADPTVPATTGSRFFGTNSNGTIYQSTVTMTGIMPEVGAAPAPAIPIR